MWAQAGIKKVADHRMMAVKFYGDGSNYKVQAADKPGMVFVWSAHSYGYSTKRPRLEKEKSWYGSG